MSATVPIIALSALIALALIARQLAYLMTSTSLLGPERSRPGSWSPIGYLVDDVESPPREMAANCVRRILPV